MFISQAKSAYIKTIHSSSPFLAKAILGILMTCVTVSDQSKSGQTYRARAEFKKAGFVSVSPKIIEDVAPIVGNLRCIPHFKNANKEIRTRVVGIYLANHKNIARSLKLSRQRQLHRTRLA